MSDNQPQRPPRMSRSTSKDNSAGLLMTVIRNLTSSREAEDRDREKANLEYNFKITDQKLDEYVVKHHSDLTAVMHAYSKISTRLNSSKTNLKEVREKLITCQKLLHCKRDELKKLWVESMENKYVLELLDQVDAICKVDEKIKQFISKKHYLNATRLLVDSLHNLETSLKHVEALKEIRNELNLRKEQMYETLVEELHKHLYVKSTAELFRKFRQGESTAFKIGRNLDQSSTPVRKVSVADMLSPSFKQSTSVLKRKPDNIVAQVDLDIEEDLSVTNPEEDSRYFILILVKCLHLLNKMPDAIQMISDRTENELMNIVKRTGRELIAISNFRTSVSKTGNVSSDDVHLNIPCTLKSSAILLNRNHRAYLLKDLCELLFYQFKIIAQLHEQLLIPIFLKVEAAYEQQKRGDCIELYTMTDIWYKIQQVLHIVSDIYLDVNGANQSNTAVISNNDKLPVANGSINDVMIGQTTADLDLNAYFVRKRIGLSAAVQAGNNLIQNNKNFLNNIQNISTNYQTSSSSQSKKNSLFRFECSSHAISLNDYINDHKQFLKKQIARNLADSGEDADKSSNSFQAIFNGEDQTNKEYIVCPPSSENIVVLFSPIMQFVSEIDDKLNLDLNNHCVLHTQLRNFAVNFIKSHVAGDLERLLEFSIKSLANFAVFSDSIQLNRLNLNTPVLLSTLTIVQCVRDLCQLMFTLPLYCDDFLTMINELLAGYKENCQTIYKLIVEREDEKRIISAIWAKDDDISRFLKILPNWNRFIHQRNEKLSSNRRRNAGGEPIRQQSSLSFDKTDESPEEIRLRNIKESAILISNITQDALIPLNEILSEVSQLKNLAQFHESLEFLGHQVLELLDELPVPENTKLSNAKRMAFFSTEHGQLSDENVQQLLRLSKEFTELSESCLLLLHLEVRVHCFYYLLPLFMQNSFSLGVDNQDVDQEILELNKDLQLIDEQLSGYMQEYKMKYLFEGVGHLISTILINNVLHIKKINENGVKRMCKNIFSIQQQLTGITMNREIALDYCRQYFELFSNNNCPEDLLSDIVEKGAVFQPSEYQNAINLMHRSLTGRDSNMLEAAQKRLTEILNEVAVSI